MIILIKNMGSRPMESFLPPAGVVSEISGIPVAYTTGWQNMLDIFMAEGHDPKYIGIPMAIDTYMHRDWDSYIHGLVEK